MSNAALCVHHPQVARILATALAIFVLAAGCGGGDDHDRFVNCRYEGSNSTGWDYRCKTVDQCDVSEPCDGSNRDCEPGLTTCYKCGPGEVVFCFD